GAGRERLRKTIRSVRPRPRKHTPGRDPTRRSPPASTATRCVARPRISGMLCSWSGSRPASRPMNDLSAMIPLLAAVLLGLGLSLVDSDDAPRELKRHRLVRVASLKTGAARIDGRLVPADNAAAPAGSPVARVA